MQSSIKKRRINLCVVGLTLLVIMIISLFGNMGLVHASKTEGRLDDGYNKIKVITETGDVLEYRLNQHLRNQPSVNDDTDTDLVDVTLLGPGDYITLHGSNPRAKTVPTVGDWYVGQLSERYPSDPDDRWKYTDRQYIFNMPLIIKTIDGYKWEITSSDPSGYIHQSNFYNTGILGVDTNANGMSALKGFPSDPDAGVYWHDNYTITYTANGYQVRYDPNGGEGYMPNSFHMVGQPKNLDENKYTKNYTVTLDPNGGSVSPTSVECKSKFDGWAMTSSGPMTMIDRYWVSPDLSLLDGAVVPIYAKWGQALIEPLPTPTRTGYIFLGWYTDAVGGDLKTEGMPINGDITLYAHWEPIKYWLQFDPNEDHGPGVVTGTMPTIQLTYDQPINLPKNVYKKTTVSNRETKYGPNMIKTSDFLGWSLSPTDLTPTFLDEDTVVNLTTVANDTVVFYAIWDDSPKFIIAEYPDRYFTVDEARSGIITADELLRTVVVYDRETFPLIKGATPGVTVFNYDATLFTSVTDETTIPTTYYLQDSYGHEAWLNITVYLTRTTPNPDSMVEYIRGLSPPYYRHTDAEGNLIVSSSPIPVDEGGLNPASIWLNNGFYTNQLNTTLSKTPSTKGVYEFSPLELKDIRNNVAVDGFNNNNLDERMKSGQFNASP